MFTFVGMVAQVGLFCKVEIRYTVRAKTHLDTYRRQRVDPTDPTSPPSETHCLALPYLTLSYLILPYLILSYLTSPPSGTPCLTDSALDWITA